MLMRAWYPTTVATRSWHCRQIIMQFLEETADDPRASIPFKLHDFGSRGTSCREQAALGGAAHLVNFLGTDTVPALPLLGKYYKASGMPGFSIPATEHSTITSWGKENEFKAYANILANYGKPGKIMACVSDSYDIFNAVENGWGGELKKKVQESGATLVIRPDSGEPVEVITRLAQIIEAKFGTSYNRRGYKIFNNVRLIQGDGVNEESIRAICNSLKSHGYSIDNIAFGMGGHLLQQLDRDTQKFAYKCSEVTIDGRAVPVFKDPITDPGKTSKKGVLDLIRRAGRYETTTDIGQGSELVTIFENGKVDTVQTLEQIRARTWEV